jgi:hypothetical protein
MLAKLQKIKKKSHNPRITQRSFDFLNGCKFSTSLKAIFIEKKNKIIKICCHMNYLPLGSPLLPLPCCCCNIWFCSAAMRHQFSAMQTCVAVKL